MPERPTASTTLFERFPVLKEIPKEAFPRHVFIIPDGNRRSARARNLPEFEGHREGLGKMLDLLRVMRELPVEIVTLWGFSSDNNSRSAIERNWLMGLFQQGIAGNLEELIGENARLVHLGDKNGLPEPLVQVLTTAEEQTKDNTGQIVCVALNFGGQDHERRLVQSATQLAAETALAHPEMSPAKIAASFDRPKINSLYDTSGLISPADLIIRTSEQRLSDVGWINGAGTELYFIPDKYFPEL